MNAYASLTTPYENVKDGSPSWDIYPRPQLVRDSFLSLNGKWSFGEGDVTDGEILVPFPPESALSGIGRPITSGRMTYRRTVSIPDGFVKDRLILHFGACDQIAELYINGKFAMRNEGGYLPFSCDITELCDSSELEIELKVTDTLDEKYPYGKQRKRRGGMWYTAVSGIWQTVWLESLPKTPIRSLKIEQNAKFAKIKINSEAEHKKLTLHADGSEYEFTGDEITVEPASAHLWSPEDPYIYRFTLETETDRVDSYFALREIGSARVGEREYLTLNGKPYLFNGLLDQGYFPDGIFLPPAPDAYRDDILLAKRLGFNTLRKHIKIEPLIFYHLCDTLGIVVFQDMVNNSHYSFIRDTALPTVGFKRLDTSKKHSDPDTRAAFHAQAEGTFSHLYNTPSVCLYTIFNEGWGQFLPDEAYEKYKAIDPSRIIDTTSGWFKATKSDVDSRHIYFKTPTLPSPDGRPIHLSEFGGYSLRIEGHLFGKSNYGYKLFSDGKSFEKAVTDLYTEGVAPLAKEGLSALIYTQLSDVEDETNGLVTYDRRVVKIDENAMREANDRVYEAFRSATEKK